MRKWHKVCRAFEENGIGVAKRPLDTVGLIREALAAG